MPGFENDAVVPDQPRERQKACGGCIEQRQDEPRFSAARRPADQHRLRADKNGGGMDGRRRWVGHE
jgi:hypothetical protein